MAYIIKEVKKVINVKIFMCTWAKDENSERDRDLEIFVDVWQSTGLRCWYNEYMRVWFLSLAMEV